MCIHNGKTIQLVSSDFGPDIKDNEHDMNKSIGNVTPGQMQLVTHHFIIRQCAYMINMKAECITSNITSQKHKCTLSVVT